MNLYFTFENQIVINNQLNLHNMFGSDAGKTGKGNFMENRRLFGNANTDPEKFNLYNGLYLLAESLERIELRLAEIEKRLDKLER